jgi:two-component system sporulation sensor kinase A/two-component system, sporulation sensor kinase E
MNERTEGRGTGVHGAGRGESGERIAALVRQMSSAERALQELLAGEVDAVVDPVSGAPLVLRHAQEELRRSEARMRLLLDQVPAVVWTTDLGLRLTSAGGRALEGVGARGNELVGRSLAELAQEHPALEGLLAAHKGALGGQRDTFEAALDGRTFEGAVEPAYDRAGQISGCVGVGLDVTERKRAQAALIEAEKLAVTGRMAASLAHEINNPLQAVVGFLSLALEDLRAGKGAQRYVEIALEELERAAGMVEHMRDLNRHPDAAAREHTDVNALLERVLALTRKKCQQRGVEVAWAPGQALPRPALQANSLQQVFMNLVLNAVDAMPGGGRLEVSTGARGDPPAVWVRFADTGVGIPAANVPRLFEPFFTTKAVGLGLGLSVSQEIVHEHGGRIEVESVEGAGATFTVRLPA